MRMLAILVPLLVPLAATGQIKFERTYDGPGTDIGYSVAQTADGGYIIAGYTSTFGAGSYDVYLIKTDAFGDTLWTRTYGGSSDDRGHSVAETSDGGYVVAGLTQSFPPGSENMYLMKANDEGDTLWTRTYGGNFGSRAYSVQPTTDGGFVVAGSRWHDVYMVKTDEEGDTLWSRLWGPSHYSRGHSVIQTSEGGYVITGWSYWDWICWWQRYVLAIRTDAVGNTLWLRHYFRGGDYDEGHSVVETIEGGYVIAGETGPGGVYLVATDSEGDTLWTRRYGGGWASELGGRSIARTADGGYIVAGTTISFGAGEADVYLLRFDAYGDTVWTRTYGGSEGDYGLSVQQTTDGGYIICGHTESFGIGGIDVYLIKTDANGFVHVNARDYGGDGQLCRYLAQNHPNPFRSTTTVAYAMPNPGRVTITIYDIRAALVRNLVSGTAPAGRHQIVWDGRDDRGHAVASGVYFCRLEAGEVSETKRMVLLR